MNKKYLLFAFLIFLLGIFLRIYKFNQVPASLNWDEVAIGWNAAAIWEAKIDQYGTRFPLSFKSYGDFKAPLLIYTTAPFIGIFGMEDWVVRLPVLLTSILSISLFYLLTVEIVKYFKLKEPQLFILVSTLLFAISPWHIRFSRGAFEATVALFFILLAIYFFFLSLKRFYLWMFVCIFSIASIYTYHSPKIFTPLYLFSLVFMLRKVIVKQIRKHIFASLLYGMVAVGLMLPLIKDTLIGAGGERSGTLIFFENNELVKFDANLLKQLVKNFWTHISPKFYIFGSNHNFRNNLKNVGLIPAVQYLFFLIGLCVAIFSKNIKKHKTNLVQFTSFVAWWFFLALLPGILSKPDTVPHTIRTINALPPVILISTLGLIMVVKHIKSKTIIVFENKLGIFVPTIILIAVLVINNVSYFIYEYFLQFPVYSAADWQYGYKEAAQVAKKYEGEVDAVIVSNKYGHPYEFFAFYQKRNPLHVIWGEMSKYRYVDNVKWEDGSFTPNSLLIGTRGEIPSSVNPSIGEIVAEVDFPDGQTAFRIVKTK
jgi:4-amino-4-deoxy-L-arabinose transferase-like glycosyltransferase